MLRNRLIPVSLAVCLCGVCACDSAQKPEAIVDNGFSARELPIINGTRVTGYDRYATVGLVFDYGYSFPIFCTGTLITPNYVLTAGHCISNCEDDDLVGMRRYMRVAFGQDEKHWTNMYDIEEFITHPNFVCRKSEISSDIALLKLKRPVPLSVASPILPLPPKFALTPSEVDSKAGIMGTSVGFGKTNPKNDNSSGTKYETTRKIYAVCSNSGVKSKNCGTRYSSYTYGDGIIFFYSYESNTCQGDSGGPTFVERDGYEFVAGVTSYGFEGCNGIDAVTNVSDFYGFITDHVKDLASGDPEDCFNGKDDNGDGLIDCDDPYCFVQKQCIPEDCTNKKDDDGNGLTDCDDPACKDNIKCQPEDCTNGVDDNDNGLIDCNEASCFVQLVCKPEICDDGIDNNGNMLIDCQDPQCADARKCQPEICTNGVDDNDNGLIDCQDPQCAAELQCQPEICNDNIDNNGNGLVDCAEFSCMGQAYCQPENCTNGVDDNLNGLMDCADPQCIANVSCQPEVCNDGIDNNANGLIDCDEESCSEECSKASGCSMMPGSKQSPFGALMMLLGALILLVFRRRETR